jgi:leucyl aminopeptidase
VCCWDKLHGDDKIIRFQISKPEARAKDPRQSVASGPSLALQAPIEIFGLGSTTAMNVTLVSQPAQDLEADAIVVGLFEGEPLSGQLAELDRNSQGGISRFVEAKELTGKSNELTTFLSLSGMKSGRLVTLGLGKRDRFDSGQAFRATAAAAKSLASKPRRRVAYYMHLDGESRLAEAAICGAMVGCQGQDLYRTEKKLTPFEELLWFSASAESVQNAWIQAESVNLARRLVNEPANEVYPESFAITARRVAKEVGLEVELWDERRLEQERCGSLLAVARGSSRAPRLVFLRHTGGKPNQPPLALVGKGVTFDSGGLSIKDNDNMKTMKCDMAGAATVLAAMQAIARLKLPVHVIGLCGLVENMLSGNAYKLGDILRARNGKTIEVLNTDAEGRLVLADVLDVAITSGAEKIIDLATLTGACMVALGRDVAGAMTNHQPWCDQVMAAAKACGEPVWQLPMFPEYTEHIASGVADIKNIGDGRWGGAITAAKFLEEFVAGKPWVHLDIAGPAFLELPKPWLDAGGSGTYVRTLVEVVRKEEA